MILQDFIQVLTETRAGQEYLALVNTAQNRERNVETAYERHHILPKGLGGTWDPENIVYLTIFEHCQAHALLAKAYPCFQTIYPVTVMSSRQVLLLDDLDKISLESIYGWSTLREQARELNRLKAIGKKHHLGHKHSEESKEKNRKAHLGRKLSEEHRRKISEGVRRNKTRRTPKGTIQVNNGKDVKRIYLVDLQKYLDRGWKRGSLQTRSEETRKRMSEARKGCKFSKESVRKRVETRRKNGGYTVSEETRRKMSEARTGKFKGYTQVWKFGRRKFIQPKDLNTYLKQGYFRTRKESLL